MSSSISSSITIADLPNLPGVRRDLSLINPKLYSQFRASRSTELMTPGSPGFGDEQLPEEDSLMSYFEDGLDGAPGTAGSTGFSRVLSAFPSDGSAYNDLSGRYSLVSQKRDRTAKSRSLPYSSTGSLPRFVREGAIVCRFLAYFTEAGSGMAGSEDPTGTISRARKVEIKVYLEDNSMEIIEPKVENSGQTAGKFLKRHPIYKPSAGASRLPGSSTGTTYGLADMYAGAVLDIYNRLYTVVDCDAATAAYMANTGLSFGSPLPLPGNIYDPKNRPGLSRSVRSTATGTGTRKKNGFFEYDRAVLRFYGIWDSRSSLFGDLVRVKVHYTLADDMMEIAAVTERNNGRDPLPTLLKKSYVMKKISPDEVQTNVRVSTPSGAARNPPESSATSRPYHWRDLQIGAKLTAGSLQVVLLDADAFTRQFYAAQGVPLGVPLEMNEQPVIEEEEDDGPYNGAVGPSGGSVNGSVVMKDGLKAKVYQGMILRYKAVMSKPSEADKARLFVIQIHLEDDTVAIREPAQRNSGHKGGIFLSRGKLTAPKGGRAMVAADCYLGAKVTILAHEFTLYDADQYTLKYMEGNCQMWQYSDLAAVSRKLANKKESLQRILITSAGLSSAVLDVNGVEEVLRRADLSLVKQEIVTIFRSLDPVRAGAIKMTKLLKFVMDL